MVRDSIVLSLTQPRISTSNSHCSHCATRRRKDRRLHSIEPTRVCSTGRRSPSLTSLIRAIPPSRHLWSPARVINAPIHHAETSRRSISAAAACARDDNQHAIAAFVSLRKIIRYNRRTSADQRCARAGVSFRPPSLKING